MNFRVMKIFFTNAIVIFMVLSGASLYANEAFELKKDRMMAGGSMTMPISYDKRGTFKMDLELSPEWSYLLIDNLELQIKGTLAAGLVSISSLPHEDLRMVSWGLAAGALYNFKINDGLYLYAGGRAFYGMMDFQIKSSLFGFEVPLGMLIPLNKHVALNVGVPLKVTFSPISAKIFERLEIPIGYLGIKALF